ncbi:DUF4397 domain-containing protein [Halobaculum sp. WSA2]|uniref:DUF4397 domain-containing protein n=1 Tax=Halobaculum saliterrae TaxID=2073113 RepID=A0A6B0SMV9_9EURY|nr:DUF4397 domain-containing protein [Halobaculum saliterrae]MXR40228.1 DUF4397 domain-containing protein [Halobaculum saliterrae]
MTDTTRRTVLGGIATGTALLVGGAGAVTADEGTERGGDEAGLRIAHASPDAPAVDVLVDGAVAVEGLEFRQVTDYLELPAGEYEVAVNVSGTDTTVFGPAEVDLAAEDYTAVALGEVSDDDTEFTVSVLADTNGANLDDDEARVRAVHASPDAPAVDVTVNDGVLTLFDGVAFGDSSGYAVVPAGEYDVEIRPDTADDDGDVVFEAEDVELAGRSTYTVFALGYLTAEDEPAAEPFGLLPTLDAGAPPRGDDDDEADGGDDGADEVERGPPEDVPGRGRGRDDGEESDD